LPEILDNTEQLLPEQVVTVLVGEAFSRLDLTAQRVMHALATYRYPVPPAAVDYLLQPYVPGVDSGPVLSRLVNMQFVRRNAGRYYLHQIDRDYAQSRIPEGEPADRETEVLPFSRFALQHRAAEWFKLARKPRDAWKTLEDLEAQLAEFELRYAGGDDDTAAEVLLEIDINYLILWGHYRLVAELHERLQGHIADLALRLSSAGSLGTAYFRMGQYRRASACYGRASERPLGRGRRAQLSGLLLRRARGCRPGHSLH
jgi:tetratricopeptide (TPR) repeat protein